MKPFDVPASTVGYALFHLRRGDTTVELSHSHEFHWGDIQACDDWLSYHRAKRRQTLKALKQTHGRGDGPKLEAVR